MIYLYLLTNRKKANINWKEIILGPRHPWQVYINLPCRKRNHPWIWISHWAWGRIDCASIILVSKIIFRDFSYECTCRNFVEHHPICLVYFNPMLHDQMMDDLMDCIRGDNEKWVPGVYPDKQMSGGIHSWVSHSFSDFVSTSHTGMRNSAIVVFYVMNSIVIHWSSMFVHLGFEKCHQWKWFWHSVSAFISLSGRNYDLKIWVGIPNFIIWMDTNGNEVSQTEGLLCLLSFHAWEKSNPSIVLLIYL